MENVTRKRVNANARQGTKERTAASRYLLASLCVFMELATKKL
jgi:hypothetical protein